MKRILILHDNRGCVACSLLPDAKRKIDINLLKESFEKNNFTVEIHSLHDLRFPSKYEGWYVLYPSSEDYGLFYKSFIEDILIRLMMDGAILLPAFEYFRAHHNKVFMELLRSRMSLEYQTLNSKVFYTIDDLKKHIKTSLAFPVVLKSSAGSGSAGVALAQSEKELLHKAKTMGKIKFNGVCYTKKIQLRHWFGMMLRKAQQQNVVETPPAREKMIVQKFIPNLKKDYKVLVFGEKYYLLQRTNRKNDFRASGSGKLEFPIKMGEIEFEVLDYAHNAYIQIGTPMLSIDIAHDGCKCHMIEFQCLNFGPYTLQFSSCYYKKENNVWKAIKRKSVLEVEIANAIQYFLAREGSK